MRRRKADSTLVDAVPQGAATHPAAPLGVRRLASPAASSCLRNTSSAASRSAGVSISYTRSKSPISPSRQFKGLVSDRFLAAPIIFPRSKGQPSPVRTLGLPCAPSPTHDWVFMCQSEGESACSCQRSAIGSVSRGRRGGCQARRYRHCSALTATSSPWQKPPSCSSRRRLPAPERPSTR